MRSNTELIFQVMDMLHHGQYFKPPVAKSKEDADANIIDARLKCTVNCCDTPIIIGFFAANMNFGFIFFSF